MQRLCLTFLNVSPTGDSFTEGSIDLKCKERVTDSDEENDPADETDGKVKFYRTFTTSGLRSSRLRIK